MNEYLRRIDERDYLTEREHREYLKALNDDLEVLKILKKNHIQTQQLVFVNTPMKTIISFQATKEECEKIKNWLGEE